MARITADNRRPKGADASLEQCKQRRLVQTALFTHDVGESRRGLFVAGIGLLPGAIAFIYIGRLGFVSSACLALVNGARACS
jgi:hypothetical protein